MRISKLTVHNYRNLDGAHIEFADNITYIVGESNTGKSNVLDLLDTIFNRYSFKPEDFTDGNKPITASITFTLDDAQIGAFGLHVDPDDGRSVEINMACEDSDSRIEFTYALDGETVPALDIRSANFLRYASVNFDSRTLAFDSQRGVGRLLGKSVTRYREQNGKQILDFFDQSEFDGLIDHLNGQLGKLTLLASIGVQASIDANDSDSVASAISLIDESRNGIRSSGGGVQYTTLVMLSILQGLASLNKNRLKASIVTLDDGRTAIRAILALDEPEIHLHPYMQRRLVKTITHIAEGEDADFNTLVKDIVGADVFQAQIVLVTHSPQILERGSYRNIVRFSTDHHTLSIVNGKDISLNQNALKPLESRFEAMREAFFARAAIIVEGETEISALPGFAETLGKDLDEYGVVLISAEGKESVPGVRQLFDAFQIPYVSIVDRDGTIESTRGNNFVTTLWDFEAEYIESLFIAGKQDLFIKILETTSPNRKRKTRVPVTCYNDAITRLGLEKQLSELLKKTFE